MNSPLLVISHNLFLTEEERQQTKVPFSEIETVGICVPVWSCGLVTSEPAEEIYCKYKVRNFSSPGLEAVSMTDSGFTISIGDKRALESIVEQGNETINFNYEAKIINNGIEIIIINYVMIQDIKVIQYVG